MERRKFEESWKEAFDQAEISPSENVWTNIELDLEKAKARKLKRRLVFYQLLAAASIVFALGIGVGVYVNNSYSPGNTLATQQTTSGASDASQATHQDTTPENLASSNNPSDEDEHHEGQADTGIQRPEGDRIASAQHDERSVSRDDDMAAPHDAQRNAPRHDEQKIASNNDGTKNGNGDITEDPNGEANRGIAGRTETNGRAEQSARTATQPDSRGLQRSGVAKAETNNVDESGKVNSSGLQKQNIVAEQPRELIADHVTNNRSDQQNIVESDRAGVTGGNRDQTALSPVNSVAVAPSEDKTDGEGATGVYPPVFERKLPALVAERKPALVLAKKEPEGDPVALMLAKLERRELEVRAQEEQAEKQSEKDKRKASENLWTSVGFAAGSFNPVVSKNSSPMLMSQAGNFAGNNADKEVKARGATYSVGVNMGKRLSERWVLQGGVNYLTQASDYNQSGLVPSLDNSSLKVPSNIKENSFMSDDGDVRMAIVDTPPYNVNNSVRYLSVPMQAGYVIINKDFGLQLNAGVSTDLLLQNTITATVDGEAVESDFEGSAYRQVNLSGLMGTEVSYRFGRRYRIALNPGMRYPFNNIYKSDDFRATRLSFDVGLRFRYIFK